MTALLDVRELTRRFGGLVALDHLTFTVEPDEIVGLIGPNGAGKTTCFNVVSGTMPPSSGSVEFDGKSIVGHRPNKIVRQGLARTWQSTAVFPEATTLENVIRGAFHHATDTLLGSMLGTPASRTAREDIRLQCLEILDQLGIAHVQDDLAGELPYGYQRRLGVAIALASNTKLIMLDEPAAGLNPEESREMGELIRQVHEARKVSVLLVEHDMRLVMGLCDRLIVLDHGALIAAGTPDEIRNNPKVIEAYLGTEDAI
jgi:branched-chain amino acid transport system ATP-binding protein